MNDLIFAFYPTVSLAKDAKITARLGAVSIGHIIKSKATVDALRAEIR